MQPFRTADASLIDQQVLASEWSSSWKISKAAPLRRARGRDGRRKALRREPRCVPEPHPRKPVRKPFPLHLPRERVIVPGPTACCRARLDQTF